MSTPDDFNELEEMLAGLPVREPSRVLDARVASTLKAGTRARLPRLAVAAAILLVGAVTLAVVFNPAPSSQDTNPPITDRPPDQPDAGPTIHLATNLPDTLNLTWSRDVVDETRYTPSGKPYRAIVREAINHRAWADPKTGETGHLSIPREELIVVKQETF